MSSTSGGEPKVADVTSPSLYLDTSDLSYLLQGKLRPGVAIPQQWLERLRAALEADKVRLRISSVHLAELALRRDLAGRGLRALEATPNIFLIMTSPLDVFEAELGLRPVAIAERKIDVAELRDFSISVKGWPWPVTGHRLASLLKFLVRWEARALNAGKRASRLSPVANETVLKVLRGDLSDLPRLTRPAVGGLIAVMASVASRFGTSLEVVAESIRQEKRGLSWAVASGSPTALPRRHNTTWNCDDARRMPASILRSCVERVHSNPKRLADQGLRYDVLHLAYVAYSDYSTIDKANFEATKAARHLLPHLRISRVGNIDPILDAIALASSPSENRQ